MPQPPNKILVGVDFSEQAENVARFALVLAHGLGAQVTILHAWHPLADFLDPQGYRERVAPRLQRQLDKLVELLGDAVPVQGVLEEGPAAQAIVRFAERWRYDLIVIGTSGMGRAERLLLGTVADRVIRTSPVPVLTVPPARP